MRETDSPRTRELLALFTLSAALLAYEVWLTRMIAIQHWHHLAQLVIAIALLGFGCAGVLVSLRARYITHRVQHWLFLSAVLVSVSASSGILIVQYLPLNMLALPWQFTQIGWMGLYALLLFPAFFCGAIFISVCFVRWPQHAGRVYAADLLGGACGALAILPLISALGLEPGLLVIVLLPVVAGLLLIRLRSRHAGLCLLTVLVVLGSFPLIDIHPAEYKPLANRLLERNSRILLERDSLSQRFTVVTSPGMHAAPGLSLNSPTGAPRQWQLFADGESAALLLLPPEPPPDFYSQLIGFAPYTALDPAPSVLFLGAESLWHTWIAQGAGANSLTITSADTDLTKLLSGLKTRNPQGIYPDKLDWAQSSPRRYLLATEKQFDLIVLEIHTSQAGMAAAQEDYLLTREGIVTALDRLKPGGLLALFVQMHSLPRDTLKAATLLHSALEEKGQQASANLAILRDWRSAVLLASLEPLGPRQLSRLREWSEQRHFDQVALPGLQQTESNRFHHRQPGLYQPIQAILAGQALKEPLFDTSASNDNRPFFFRFFRWQSLPQLLETTGSLWRQHMEWGYLLGLSTLLVGALLAILLLALPFALSRKITRPPRPSLLIAYFGSIGLGFMMAEIAMLQRASLLLDATAISLSAVLAAMLAGASFGSWCQNRWQPRGWYLTMIFGLVMLAILMALPLLNSLFNLTAAWPTGGRALIAVGLITVLGIPMGFPLPHALHSLRQQPSSTIAWAWAANGFASVLGTLMASLIAMHWGLSTLMLLAALCYAMAASLLPALHRQYES